MFKQPSTNIQVRYISSHEQSHQVITSIPYIFYKHRNTFSKANNYIINIAQEFFLRTNNIAPLSFFKERAPSANKWRQILKRTKWNWKCCFIYTQYIQCMLRNKFPELLITSSSKMYVHVFAKKKFKNAVCKTVTTNVS